MHGWYHTTGTIVSFFVDQEQLTSAVELMSTHERILWLDIAEPVRHANRDMRWVLQTTVQNSEPYSAFFDGTGEVVGRPPLPTLCRR